MGIPSFQSRTGSPLRTLRPDCLQVNLGKLCNQACKHCHVDAGPKRTELMDRATVDQVLDAIDFLGVSTLDITGGAPEMNPNFRHLVREARKRGVTKIIDRCNLTILLEPGFEWVLDFLVDNEVEVTASLPFYMEENVDRQRGKGVFRKSIEALRRLNARGYGDRLSLNLVYNPQGAYLPPDQEELRDIFRNNLKAHFGVVFHDLYTLTNMPIARFEHYLKASGNYDRYMKKLVSRFNPATLSGLMCRSLISVGYDGLLYDCDFNQMLQIPLHDEDRPHIGNIRTIAIENRDIVVGVHCFGCTAGGGSSCGGALEKKGEAKDAEPIPV